MSTFSQHFAKRRKQIWDSSLTVQFLPNGPSVKALIGKMEHTGKPQSDDYLKFGILSTTDCDLKQYLSAVCSDGRKFKITGTQTIKEECLNITAVNLL